MGREKVLTFLFTGQSVHMKILYRSDLPAHSPICPDSGLHALIVICAISSQFHLSHNEKKVLMWLLLLSQLFGTCVQLNNTYPLHLPS